MSNQNAEVVDLLQAIGDLMELRGDDAFRVRAYREAARQMDLVTEDVTTLSEEDRLTGIKGIGPSIARTITEFLQSGESRQLNDLREEVPESLVEMLGIRHFGPSRIVKVHRALQVTTLEELEEAAHDGRLATVSGFGQKSVETLLTSIERFRLRRGRVARYVAESVAQTIQYSLRQMADLADVEIVGGMRRLCDSVGEITMLAASDDPPAVLEAFERLTPLRDVEVVSAYEAVGQTRERHLIRLHVVPPSLWEQGLVAFTGSEVHVAQLRERGRSLGLAAEIESGASGVWSGLLHPIEAERDEAAVYERLGLPWLAPELREGRGEIEAALEGRLPVLLETRDIRGDMHLHTTWSDGRNTVMEMGEQAQALGLEYIAIADHSPSLGVARGLTLERLAGQRAEIKAADEQLEGIRILSGVEVDIRHDGSLDYPDEVMAGFDFVTASLHSGFQQSGEQLTERVIKAMRSPHVDCIGHLTGRILGWRDGLDLDVERILQVAAETCTAMEINAWPNRLDLDEENARRAKELGIKLVINTDSHAAAQMEHMHYGVEIARRAWLTADDVLNTLSFEALLAYLASRPQKG